MAQQQRHFTRKVKPLHELKKSTRNERKRAIENVFKDVTNTLPEDVTSVKVDIQFQGGINMSFFPTSDTDELGGKLTAPGCEPEKLQQLIALKDRFRISDACLHEMHMLFPQIPPKNQVVAERKRLSTTIPIQESPLPNEDAAFRRLQDVVEYQVTQGKMAMPTKLLLRFACDGAKIGKKRNSVRGCVKVMTDRDRLPETEGHISITPDDELTLFFFLGEETKANLEKFSRSTFLDMRAAQIDGLSIQDNTVPVEWILTCDWKALALLKGINAANAKYFCLWCYCTKSQIYDFSIPAWAIQRSNDDRKVYLGKPESKGYIDEDACDFIGFDQMCPDDLHLRIRISTKLFNQVVSWAIDGHRTQELQNEMKRIGVAFHTWQDRGNDGQGCVRRWSQPDGDELEVIINKTQLHNILEDREDRHLSSVDSLSVAQLKDELTTRGLPAKGKKAALVARLKEALGPNTKVAKWPKQSRLKAATSSTYDYESDEDEEAKNKFSVELLQEVWTTFSELMKSTRAFPGSQHYLQPQAFQDKARKWATLFRKATFDEDVTPYIHCLVYHVPQFLEKYRYLHDVGVSQVERKNLDHREAFFGATSWGAGRYPKKVAVQILQRENRQLWAKCANIERKKRKYTKKAPME